MKNLQILLLLLCSCFTQLLSQPDLQWLIFDSKGKMSAQVVNGELENKYPGPQMTGEKFTVSGVRQPNRTNNKKTKNNVFILYENGEHFNSRENINTSSPYYTKDFFYINSPLPVHKFTKSTSSQIDCMYLTNIYEEDDPPIGLNVQSGWNETQISSGTYELGVTVPKKAISATHDITRRKDVTLILYNKELKVAGIDTTAPFTLTFNKIVNKSTKKSYQGAFFTLSPIFTYKSFGVSDVYPFDPLNRSVTDSSITILFDDPDYLYVNLRPQGNLEMYFPQTINGEPTHMALFTVKQGNISVTHTEDLVSEHDPNFVQLCKLIRTRNNKTFLKYRVQFENASMQPASGLAVEFTFDNRFDLSNTKLKKIKAGQNTHRFGQNDGRLPRSFPPIPLCALENNGRTARVNFPSGWQVAAGGSRNNAIGYVDFIVRVDQDVRWERGEVPAMPMECKVFFKDIPFHVDVFKDIIILKSNSQSYPEDGERRASTNASEYNASLPGCIQNL